MIHSLVVQKTNYKKPLVCRNVHNYYSSTAIGLTYSCEWNGTRCTLLKHGFARFMVGKTFFVFRHFFYIVYYSNRSVSRLELTYTYILYVSLYYLFFSILYLVWFLGAGVSSSMLCLFDRKYRELSCTVLRNCQFKFSDCCPRDLIGCYLSLPVHCWYEFWGNVSVDVFSTVEL